MSKPFKCKRCGLCCKVFEIGPLDSDDVDRIGEENIYVDEYQDRHVQRVRKDWAEPWTVQGVCVFLTKDMECTVNDRKPDVCKWYECRGEKKRRRTTAIKQLQEEWNAGYREGSNGNG